MNEQWVPHRPDTWPWRIGTLKADTAFRSWRGHGAKPEFTERTVPAGTRVKIVMVSRFGDVGITTDLAAETGYGARVALAELEPVPGASPLQERASKLDGAFVVKASPLWKDIAAMQRAGLIRIERWHGPNGVTLRYVPPATGATS